RLCKALHKRCDGSSPLGASPLVAANTGDCVKTPNLPPFVIRDSSFDPPRFWLSSSSAALFNRPMRESSLSFLRTLVNTPSPVGHETRGQRVWLDYAKEFADETFSDAYGNCVAVLHKGGSPRLMLAGHADEIAMAVNYITDEGFIHVRKMGGV